MMEFLAVLVLSLLVGFAMVGVAHTVSMYFDAEYRDAVRGVCKRGVVNIDGKLH